MKNLTGEELGNAYAVMQTRKIKSSLIKFKIRHAPYLNDDDYYDLCLNSVVESVRKHDPEKPSSLHTYLNRMLKWRLYNFHKKQSAHKFVPLTEFIVDKKAIDPYNEI